MKNMARWMLVAAAAMIVAGCDDDDDDDDHNPGPQTPPRVTLYLHDAPPGVVQVVSHVTSVQVHVADASAPAVALPDAPTDEARWKTLAVDQTLDFVAAQGPDQAVSLGQLPLPVGRITHARLQLLAEGGMTITMAGDRGCYIDTPDLQATVPLTESFRTIAANNNDNLEIWLDLDLAASLRQREDGCFDFVPVLRISRARNNGTDLPLQ